MWEMTIRVFRSVRYPGDFEVNLIGRVWNLRIGRSQVALWRTRSGRAIFDWHKRHTPPRRNGHDKVAHEIG